MEHGVEAVPPEPGVGHCIGGDIANDDNHRDTIAREKNRASYCTLFRDLEGCGS
jgi:hypothetical protein